MSIDLMESKVVRNSVEKMQDKVTGGLQVLINSLANPKLLFFLLLFTRSNSPWGFHRAQSQREREGEADIYEGKW